MHWFIRVDMPEGYSEDDAQEIVREHIIMKGIFPAGARVMVIDTDDDDILD